MKKSRIGKIDVSALSTSPEKHEYETAKYLADRGFDIVFIKPSNVKGSNSPDFTVCGKMWETKYPTGRNKRTFEDNLRKAMKQSRNIIFDLRKLKLGEEEKCLGVLRKQTDKVLIKTLLVILRDGRLLTIKGKFDIT